MVRSQLGEVLYLVARHPDGTWTPAERVGFLPLPRIVANQVDIAQVGADLHAVVRATNRQLYHAIRRANGSWTAFGNATNEAGALSGDLMDISVTAAGGQLQVAVCTTDSGLFHTIRFLDGNWQRFGDVKQVAGSDVGYEVTIAGE
jgi:hypothetical protein